MKAHAPQTFEIQMYGSAPLFSARDVSTEMSAALKQGHIKVFLIGAQEMFFWPYDSVVAYIKWSRFV